MPSPMKKKLIIFAAKDISQNRRIPLISKFFAQKGFEVEVYALTAPNPRLNDAGVKFHVFPSITLIDMLLNWMVETESNTTNMFRPRFSGSRILGFIIGAIELLKLKLQTPLTYFILMIYGRHISSDALKKYRNEKRYAEVLRLVYGSIVSDRRRRKFNNDVRKQIQKQIDSDTILFCHDRYSAELVTKLSKRSRAVIFDIVELIRQRSRPFLETRSRIQLREIEYSESLKETAILLTVSSAIADYYDIKRPIQTILNGRQRAEFVKAPSSNSRTLGFSGSFFPGCGLKNLLHSLAHMSPEYNLLLVGHFSSEAYRAEIEIVLRERKIEDRVEIIAGLEFHEIPKRLSQASIYVMPYHPKKMNLQVSMPNRLFDALSANLPIVAQKGLYLGEWVTAEKIGFSVEFSDPEQSAQIISEAIESEILGSFIENTERVFEETCYENQMEHLDRFLKQALQ